MCLAVQFIFIIQLMEGLFILQTEPRRSEKDISNFFFIKINYVKQNLS